MPRRLATVAVALAVALGAASCGSDGEDAAPATTSAAPSTTSTTTTAATTTTTAAPAANPRPPWLGTRILPRTPAGYAAAQPTPPELRDRRLVTVDILPPPPDGAFHSSVVPVPDAVRSRSTWSPACPVGIDDLRYVTVSFWGFDSRAHTGELLVHRDVAGAMVRAFARLFELRFPIEEMRIASEADLDAPPTGDGNTTSSFVCRPARGSTRWSDHAYGRAVDVNPFQNPYVKGDVVLPELATAYVDRSWRRPGMFFDGDAAVAAFESEGLRWGGRWTSPKDQMHFSTTGR